MPSAAGTGDDPRVRSKEHSKARIRQTIVRSGPIILAVASGSSGQEQGSVAVRKWRRGVHLVEAWEARCYQDHEDL